MALSIDLSLPNLILLGTLVYVGKKCFKLLLQWKTEKMLEKWTKSPIRNKVILHTLWRCPTLPTISPFAMKLETYLKLAKIPYEIDTTNPGGSKGKLPWITYNGTHVADSHLCIQFLNKKFSVDLNKNSTPEQVAVARACRIMLEEHFVWGIVRFRWVENLGNLSSLMKIPAIFKYMFAWTIQGRMEENGIGKHTPSEIYQMMEDDLRTVSTLLGNKKLLGGEVPCEEDCSVFGLIAQALWGSPGSSFETLCNGELSNLREYCERMKNLCWPDWEKCLAK